MLQNTIYYYIPDLTKISLLTTEIESKPSRHVKF